MKQGKPMQRSPMARGTSQLKTKSPMNRGTPLRAKSAMKANAKPIRKVSKTNAKREKSGEDKLCRGQPCYLAIPGCCRNDIASVVPAHSNQLRHGKGKGIKALDVYTVPACRDCHSELDQGKRFTREEKFAIWDSAYARWLPVRDLLQSPNKK
jgi:hypothetical protein